MKYYLADFSVKGEGVVVPPNSVEKKWQKNPPRGVTPQFRRGEIPQKDMYLWSKNANFSPFWTIILQNFGLFSVRGGEGVTPHFH